MFEVNSEIGKAHTIDSAIYKSEHLYENQIKDLFKRSWQYLDICKSKPAESLIPTTFLGSYIPEPLIYSQDSDSPKVLSNVCTHRGKVVLEKPSSEKLIRCGYHGRCFRNTGKCHSMPRFDGVENFPSAKDDLKEFDLQTFAGLSFTSLAPNQEFSDLVAPMVERLDFLDLSKLHFSNELSKTYSVNANWALYCDNYLEGFHVPFVHPSLEASLDFSKYSYELFDSCNLQLGIANSGEPHFDLPKDHIDYGKKVFGYYFWMFPNMMFNFYPWGLSFNQVIPVSPRKSRIEFRTYLFEGTEHKFEDTNLDITELEDEAVVESVQEGILSETYRTGRYSPQMERCVHHFHRLLCQHLC